MVCSNCGAEVDNKTKFCGTCGTKVVESTKKEDVKPAKKEETKSENSDTKVVNANLTNKGKFIDKTKELFRDKKVRLALGVLAVFIIAFVVFLLVTYKSPKQIFDRAIDDTFKSINNSMTGDLKSAKGEYNVKIETENLGKIDSVAKKLSLNFDYGIDYDKKIMNVNFKPTYGNDKIIDASVNLENEKAYVYLNEAFDKFIQLPLEKKEYNEFFEVMKNGYSENNKIVMEEYKKAFKKALSKEYFSKDKTKITISDKSVDVKKSTLTLSGNDFNEIAKNLAKNLAESEKFIKAYAAINELSEANVKRILSDINLPAVPNTSTINIDIYTKGFFNTFKGFSVNIEADNTTGGIDIYKVDSENYEYNLSANGTNIGTGDINVVEKDNNIKLSVSLKIGTGTIKLFVNNNNSKNAKISPVKINDSVKLEEIDYLEQTSITEDIINSKGMTSLLKDISMVMYGF